MGQAKNRGLFADRQAAAYEKIDAMTAQLAKDRTEHIAQLEAAEAKSDEMALSYARQMIIAHWKYSDISRKVAFAVMPVPFQFTFLN